MLLAWTWFFRVVRMGHLAPENSLKLSLLMWRERRCPWPELTHICDGAGLSILLLGHVSWRVEPSAKNFRLGWIHLWAHLLIVVVFYFFIIIIFISEVYSDTLLQAGKRSWEANLGAGGDFSSLRVAGSFLPFHSRSNIIALYPAGLAPKKG